MYYVYGCIDTVILNIAIASPPTNALLFLGAKEPTTMNLAPWILHHQLLHNTTMRSNLDGVVA